MRHKIYLASGLWLVSSIVLAASPASTEQLYEMGASIRATDFSTKNIIQQKQIPAGFNASSNNYLEWERFYAASFLEELTGFAFDEVAKTGALALWRLWTSQTSNTNGPHVDNKKGINSLICCLLGPSYGSISRYDSSGNNRRLCIEVGAGEEADFSDAPLYPGGALTADRPYTLIAIGYDGATNRPYRIDYTSIGITW